VLLVTWPVTAPRGLQLGVSSATTRRTSVRTQTRIANGYFSWPLRYTSHEWLVCRRDQPEIAPPTPDTKREHMSWWNWFRTIVVLASGLILAVLLSEAGQLFTPYYNK
jgi:hypothetical protein